jgi:hypothetical protein
MTLALIITILIAAGLLVWALLVNDSRRFWKSHDELLKAQLDIDEALLEQLRGPRRTADQVRGEGL